MPTNDFLPFATDSGATVLPQSDYLALPARGTGYQNGMLPAARFNKPIRQAAFVASMIGDFVVKHAVADFLDDGNSLNALYLYELAHRGLVSFTSDTTLSVPGDYDTLQEGLLDIATRFIPSNVTVVFSLGAGDHVVDSSIGSIVINHPSAERIRIVGQPLTAAFPIASAVNSATASTVEAVLRNIWPTRIVVSGNRQCFYLQTKLGRLENILIIGDKTSGQHGLLIGEWQGEMSSGTARIVNCWGHNLGSDAWRANYASFVQGQNVGASHCGEYGFRAANVSGMQIGGSFISVRNGSGVVVRDQSFIEAIAGAQAAFDYNTGHGLACGPTGAFVSTAAAALSLSNNTAGASLVLGGSFADYPATATGTGTCTATAGSQQFFNGGATLTASPTRGSTGNANSYSGA